MNATLAGCPAIPALLDDYLHQRLPGPQHAILRDHLDTCPWCWTIWNRYRWDAAAGHPLLAALRDFLGSSYRPYLDSSRALRDEWIAAQPRTTAEIRHFFENSEAYLYNLVIWHASGNRPGYVTAARPYLTGARIILDFGSGIGQDTIDLRNLGHAVLPCDLPCPSARFMRYRLRQAGHDHRVADPRRLDPPPPADTLWIIDTLDHLPDIPAALGPVLRRVDRSSARTCASPARTAARASTSGARTLRSATCSPVLTCASTRPRTSCRSPSSHAEPQTPSPPAGKRARRRRQSSGRHSYAPPVPSATFRVRRQVHDRSTGAARRADPDRDGRDSRGSGPVLAA
jgi:hypothetical protein